MPGAPSGTITFLFTDIEGSTRLWERFPAAMRLALSRHDQILREAIERNHGYVFKTVGDAFCAAFSCASDALNAALAAHLALLDQEWGETGPIRVRIGLHTGEAEERGSDYFGQTLNRVARLQGAGHGQQTLISRATYASICDCLPHDVTLHDRGLHRLKDLLAPEHIYEVLHPLLPAEFPPLKSLDYLPTNLPRQTTSFIGREPEMEEVKRLLKSSALVTLTGAGGTGKTRLSLQIGAELIEDYREGVWLVELAALSDPSLVPHRVASALSIREEAGRPLVETLTDHFREKELLLVLDNCEHVLDEAAQLADTVLKQCPQVRIMASSRERLGIAGEQVYCVPSLEVPFRNQAVSLDPLLGYEAVRLFAERAVLHDPDFMVTERNASAVASICQRLDGIPLAIELAAAQIRALHVEEINRRLDDRFRLLTGGSRSTLPRQQTLRALMDWSYNLLNAQEKAALSRLSVFAGGWTLEAAEALCSEEEAGNLDTVAVLTSLVDKSLVAAEQTTEQARYRLLETVRQYAGQRLEENGETEMCRCRHLDFFLALAEEAGSKLKGAEQAQWFGRLEVEHENLRAALDWSLSQPGSSEALRLCGALQRFWWTRGYYSEGRKWCVQALEKSGSEMPTRERAKALNGAGQFASDQGDYAAAQSYHEESLAICRQIGDRTRIASSLNNLGSVAYSQGHYAAARNLYGESLNIRRETGDRGGIAKALNNLGLVSERQSDYASARACYEESVSIKREIGDQNGIANSLNNLGGLAYSQSDCAAARRHYGESLAIFREIGDRSGIAYALNGLGLIAYSQGDDASAQGYFHESLRIKQEIGDRSGIGMSLNNLGSLAYSRGDYASARLRFEESLTVLREIGDRDGIGMSLNGLGAVACAQADFASAQDYHAESLTIFREIGDRNGIACSLEALARLKAAVENARDAARLWGAAEALREEIGSPVPRNERDVYDRNVAAARISMGVDALAAAWSEGRAMTMEQAIEDALAEM